MAGPRDPDFGWGRLEKKKKGLSAQDGIQTGHGQVPTEGTGGKVGFLSCEPNMGGISMSVSPWDCSIVAHR